MLPTIDAGSSATSVKTTPRLAATTALAQEIEEELVEVYSKQAESFQTRVMDQTQQLLTDRDNMLDDARWQLQQVSKSRQDLGVAMSHASDNVRRLTRELNEKKSALRRLEDNAKCAAGGFKNETTRLASQVQAAERELKKMKEREGNLATALAEAKQRNETLMDVTRAYSRDVKMYRSVESHLESELNAKEKKLKETSTQQYWQSMQMRRLEEANAQLKVKEEDQQGKIKQLQREVEALAQRDRQTSSKYEELLKNWQTALDAMNKRDAMLHKLASKYENVSLELTTQLKERLGWQQEREALLRDRSATHERDRLSRDLSVVRGKTEKLERERSEMASMLDTYRRQADRTDVQLRELERLKQTLTRHNEHTQENYHLSMDENQRLRRELGAEKMNLAATESQLRATKERTLVENKVLAHRFNTTLVRLENRTARVTVRSMKSEAEYEQAQAENDQLKAQLHAIKEQYSRLRTDAKLLDDLRERNEREINVLKAASTNAIEEQTAPLKNTIRALKKELVAKAEQVRFLELQYAERSQAVVSGVNRRTEMQQEIQVQQAKLSVAASAQAREKNAEAERVRDRKTAAHRMTRTMLTIKEKDEEIRRLKSQLRMATARIFDIESRHTEHGALLSEKAEESSVLVADLRNSIGTLKKENHDLASKLAQLQARLQVTQEQLRQSEERRIASNISAQRQHVQMVKQQANQHVAKRTLESWMKKASKVPQQKPPRSGASNTRGGTASSVPVAAMDKVTHDLAQARIAEAKQRRAAAKQAGLSDGLRDQVADLKQQVQALTEQRDRLYADHGKTTQAYQATAEKLQRACRLLGMLETRLIAGKDGSTGVAAVSEAAPTHSLVAVLKEAMKQQHQQHDATHGMSVAMQNLVNRSDRATLSSSSSLQSR